MKNPFISIAGVNNFPDGFELPNLPEKGTIVSFKLLMDPTLQIVDGKKVERYPSMFTFVPTATVYDEKTERSFDIAMVSKFNEKESSYEVHKIRFDANADKGTYRLIIGRSPKDDLAYLRLVMDSGRKRQEENDPFPGYVTGVEPYFEMVDEKQIASKKLSALDQKYAAYDHAKSLADSDLRDMAILLGMYDKADIETLRANVRSFADTYPKEYMAHVNDEDKYYKQLFKRALQANLLHIAEYDVRWSADQRTMFTMRTDVPNQAPTEFAYYMRTVKAAEPVAGILKKMIDEAEGATAAKKKKKETEK